MLLLTAFSEAKQEDNRFGSVCLCNSADKQASKQTEVTTVPESPGIPVTGSPSILKGYHNSLIDGSPFIRQEVDL